MNQLRILSPDKAKAKARAKVKKFQLDKAKRALEEKQAAKRGPETKAEPKGVLFIFHIGGNRQIKDGIVLKLADITDGKADFEVLENGPRGVITNPYLGHGEGTGFNHERSFSVFIVKITPEKGTVDVVVQDTRLSPEEQKKLDWELITAARHGTPEKIKRLLDAGADLEARNNIKRTPFMQAAEWGITKNCLAFIERGADLYAKDHQGKTAMDIAIHNERTETAIFLDRRGVKKGCDVP
ncbi:MAG: ankyrin repeat domain-containing protein [bacterium]|nr:ankyrin repeat domain-containing protein [bacterium]